MAGIDRGSVRLSWWLLRVAVVPVAVMAQMVAFAGSGAIAAAWATRSPAAAVPMIAPAAARQATSPEAATAPSARNLLGHLRSTPLPFIRNDGQVDPSVAYYAAWGDASAFFTQRGLTLSLASRGRTGGYAMTEGFVGASRVRPVGEGRLSERVSYFSGPRPNWRTALPTFGTVRYPNLWDGVDASFSAVGDALEDTYVVRPGADPSRIALRYRGARVTVVAEGRLRIDTPARTLFDARPIAYQVVDAARRPVPAAFQVTAGPDGGTIVRFRIGGYDRRLPLVIDPLTQVYTGYFGGPGIDQSFRVSVDSEGAAYMSGYTTEGITDYRSRAGRLPLHRGSQTGFVAKIDPTGTSVDYVSYIGGSGTTNAGLALAVDSAGGVYVAGATNSDQATFPVTVGPDLTYAGKTDGFVAKLSPDGTTLEYCGYVGGAAFDQILRIVIDSSGAAYVAGETASDQTTLPVTVGPSLVYGGGPYDGMVAKVSPDGSTFDYLGYVGGAGFDLTWGIAVDPAGDAYITGATRSDETTFPVSGAFDLTANGNFDAYVGEVTADGTGLNFLGYLGGAGDDYGRWLSLGPDGSIYLTGYTTSDQSTFPVIGGPDLTYSGGVHDAFICKIAPGATGIVYCGYLGGSNDDLGRAIVPGPGGTVFVVGESNSTDFPVVGGPQFKSGGAMDGWLAQVSDDGTRILQSTYIGGLRHDLATGVALGPDGAVYVTGETSSIDLPVAVGPGLSYNGGDFDAYIAKYVLTPSAIITSAPPTQTNQPDAAFEFTSDDPAATFTCALDGDAPAPCVSPLSVPGLAEGPHTMSIVATRGLTGPPAVWTWTVDTAAPVTTFTKQPKDPTSSTTAVFAFVSNESGSTFSCSLDGGPVSPCASGGSYPGLADGSHAFAVYATDQAGNVGASVGAAWIVDTIPPTVTIVAGPTDPTRKPTTTFSLATDDPSATLTCSVDVAAYKRCVSGVKYSGLADGPHVLAVVGKDAVGNASAPVTWSWTVDTVAPTPTVTSGPSDPTGSSAATFTFTAGESSVGFRCSLDGGTSARCASGITYADLADGSHTFGLTATDAAGNQGTAAAWMWTVDTTAPTVTITSGPTDPTSSTDATFTFTADEQSVTYVCSLDGGAAPCESGITYSDLELDIHTFVVAGTDAVGNQGPAATWTWNVVAPGIHRI